MLKRFIFILFFINFSSISFALEKCKWNTIAETYIEIDDLRDNENEYDLDRLKEIDEYISELEDIHKSYL